VHQQGGKPTEGPNDDEHVIPPTLPYSVLAGLVLDHSEFEEKQIRDYVEWQTRHEHVEHLEKVKTEYVHDQRYVAWDVWTDHQRWWVITGLTNLYPQSLFPSLDYCFSLHIGVTTRVLARQRSTASEASQHRLLGAFRRWQQAAELADTADEAEEFQAVGNHCRMSLLELANAVASNDMISSGQTPLKADDFVGWSDSVANAIAPGQSNERIRGYLKGTAKEAWQLVSWLVHAKNASKFDGRMAVDATLHVIESYEAALQRHENGLPDRCGLCGSYRIALVNNLEDKANPFLMVCERCGAKATWMAPPPPEAT